ncbi:hypothetical protein ACFV3R_25625 [Streptomyces sp. NPDC059740]|uniref:hypothetical protein n=1 Tax=Streptomyces sp. NPDC059740 TaxID=3346926 RepID=UPI0036609C28
MNTLTAVPVGTTNDERTANARGIADAYDEYLAGTPITILIQRRDAMADHLTDADDAVAYVFGYSSAIVAMTRDEEFTTDTQTGTAWSRRQRLSTEEAHRRERQRRLDDMNARSAAWRAQVAAFRAGRAA